MFPAPPPFFLSQRPKATTSQSKEGDPSFLTSSLVGLARDWSKLACVLEMVVFSGPLAPRNPL